MSVHRTRDLSALALTSRRSVLRHAITGSALLLGACARRRLSGDGGADVSAGEPVSVPASVRPAISGLDAMVDLHHGDPVRNLAQARAYSGIHAVMHKATEGVGWVDPQYALRREQARAAGMLWGAYHFGTRQYPGGEQARAFLAAVQPQPGMLLALDLEMNEMRPSNSMTLAQAEDFVRTIWAATGRLPMVYASPNWADGMATSKGYKLEKPIGRDSILAACDLWLADYRENFRVPLAWADRGWHFWQYTGDSPRPGPYAPALRGVAGIDQCDRNLFVGDLSSLRRYWTGAPV